MISGTMSARLQFLWQKRQALVPLYGLSVIAGLSSWTDAVRPGIHAILIASPVLIAVSAIVLSFRLTLRTLAVVLAIMVLSFLAFAGGVHIGFPFGELVYTTALGPKALDVPIVIPFFWLALLIPAWTASAMMLKFRHVVVASFVVTAFDAVLELAAGSLDLWHWRAGAPSEFSYISWFAVSAISFSLLESYGEHKEPHWIVPHLLVVQLLFFIVSDAGIRFLIQ